MTPRTPARRDRHAQKALSDVVGSLLRPFLLDVWYTADERGIGVATFSLFATLTGTFLGGAATTVIGEREFLALLEGYRSTLA